MSSDQKTTKAQFYENLIAVAKSLVENETDVIANTANISSHLFNEMNSFSENWINWSGFYILRKGELVLGPFIGKPACIRIKIGKGVCGTAVAQQKTQRVYDVHAISNHIACDGNSNSEIVVPLFSTIKGEKKIVGVLDIDSPKVGAFEEIDQENLEVIAKIVESSCNWEEIAPI